MSAKYAFKNMNISSEANFFILNTYYCDKNGLLPFNFGYIDKLENLTLCSFLLPVLIDNSFSNVSIKTEWARNMNMLFQSKIMIIKKISNSSAYNL